jgi:hypothetical protein
VGHVPLNASPDIWSLPSAAYSIVSNRTMKSSMSRESKLTLFYLVLMGIAGVKVCCAENETQAVGGLSNHEEMYGKELEEQC